MRNYQKKKDNPYRLPHCLYMRMIYLIKDYDRICAERKKIIESSPAPDSHGSGLGNPTETKGIKLAMLDQECDAVTRAIEMIPTEYRSGVLNNIQNHEPYPITAGEATFRRYKYKLIYTIAELLYLV